MPKMNIFLSVRLYLFLLIALLKMASFSIRWSAVKNIKGCSFGISLIKVEAKIAGPVFCLDDSRTILYFFILNFFRYCLTFLTYFLFRV